MKNHAFTLAEIMIVLAVIGVLSAVLIPIARNSMPDENIMKFKKAHNTLLSAIRELVTSDKYYLDGDLGIKPDGTFIDGKNNEEDRAYFCETIADLLSTKETNCSKAKYPAWDFGLYNEEWQIDLDEECKKYIMEPFSEIQLTNGVSFYQINPATTFGIELFAGSDDLTGVVSCIEGGGNEYECYKEREYIFYGNEGKRHFSIHNKEGKIFCIDIDGTPKNGSNNCDDAKDICPFGYAIRADGKIILGERAKEWLEKDILNKD